MGHASARWILWEQWSTGAKPAAGHCMTDLQVVSQGSDKLFVGSIQDGRNHCLKDCCYGSCSSSFTCRACEAVQQLINERGQGARPAAGNCIRDLQGVPEGLGKCLTDLIECGRDHCLKECCYGSCASSGSCRTCNLQKCNGQFSTCAGMTPS
mmetsp:Transcript_12390/g.31141  ORF Transcript_12390/g.31141 Transcript_12390/m.31141 type:complete len:153 (+) Transcript_12390:263-721(+)